MPGRRPIAMACCAAALATLTLPTAALAEDSLWDTLRENGRAIMDELKERARPRVPPSREESPRPEPEAEPTDFSGVTAEWGPPDVTGPTFTRITIEPRGAARFDGRGTPGSRIVLSSSRGEAGSAVVAGDGHWSVTLGRKLSPGVHRIDAAVDGADGRKRVAGADVRLSIPDRLPGEVIIAYSGEGEADPARERAEAIARDAGEAFDGIVGRPGERVADTSRERRSAEPERRVPAETSSTNPVVRWLERSARDYQDSVARELSVPGEPPAAPAPREAETGIATKPQDPKGEGWLERAGREYRDEVAPRLSAPGESAPPQNVAREEPQAPAAVREAKPAPQPKQPADAWSVPPETKPPVVSAAEQARRASEKRAADEKARRERESEDARRRAEAQRLAEARRAEEQARRAEEERRATEARLKDEAVRREAEAKRAEEAQRQADTRRAEEQARQQGEAQRRADESQRKADDARREAERRDAERQRLAVQAKTGAEARRRLDEERRKEEADRRATEAAKKAETRRIAEEAARVEAERKAAAKRAAGEEAERRKAERKRLADEARAAAEQRQAEALRKRREAEEERAAARAPAVERKPEEQRLAASEPRAEGASQERPAKARRQRDRRPAEGSASGDDEAAPCPPSRARQRKGMTVHIVQPGDTLWGLAERHYGSGTRYSIIYRANRGRIPSPHKIFDCRPIYVPDRRVR